MTNEELTKVLEKHKKWLYCEGGIRADLRGADLRGADLYEADLCGANLCKADLCKADLRGANLCEAKLDEKEMIRLGIILKKEMIGYKKLDDGTICKLAIPKGAIVFSINNGKCRTNKATVLEGEGVSIHDHEFEYEVGKELEIGDFCLAYNEECASGIHFFRTRKEAENYED